MWHYDNNGKYLLPDGDPKPCKPDPIKNGPKNIKDILGFTEYWKKLYEEDITRHVRDTHKPLIAYWDSIRLSLMTHGSDNRTTLTQGFGPQNYLTVVESNTMFFSNRDVCEEFAMNEHYVGPVRNPLVLSFCLGVDCPKGYMVLVQARDEDHSKLIWLV